MHLMRRAALLGLSAGLLLLLAQPMPGAAGGAAKRPTPAELAQLNVTSLTVASYDIEQQALASGAITHRPHVGNGVRMLLASVTALTKQAIAADPSLTPADTTAVMGPVPRNISHHLVKRPGHRHRSATHTLLPFARAIPDGGSSGIGHDRKHDGATPAPFQTPDGVFVDPVLQPVQPATIGLVALRAALKELGQPYVWGGAGPSTFDCSGLVQWAYAHAGIRLTHHAADQWNEGRLIPGKDILPGDLIMFGRPIFHVGMYLGAGWMLNAPYTGQWVNIVPVPTRVTGVIRP
jgi:cell wall-associated NlpC family hydrolase